jgi:DeoR/GlpR family transcriptional regulator of sugar metabolism
VVSNFQVAAIDEIDKLISDDRLDASAVDALANHDVECLLAVTNLTHT